MVVEELHFLVDEADREGFLQVEQAVWTAFLETCDGFVRKERWIADDDPRRIIVMIWWDSIEQWKRITPAEVDAVDKQMGSWFRPVDVVRAHHVLPG
jgi:uncharacterized protein (TIGR03792 family)